MPPPDRGDLPIGTLTFLFSDIEGSTRLVLDLGPAAYAELLARHHAILRAAFAANGGAERGTEGDSFFVVFRDAPSAVRAAVDGQLALGRADWGELRAPRVRMGIHTGAPAQGGDDYVGIDVNRAARIAAAAHGGEVLVSDATRALVDGALPAGVALRDLGSHRLKDLDRPERLVQLVIDGLPSDFPPPRAIDARRGALPPRLTSFVGREAERAALEALIATSRVVTITGPGGTGKTSLAVAVAGDVADRFPDGAWFVALDSIADPGLVPAAIARALGLDREDPRPPEDRLVDFVRDRELLLVLDNFEHLQPAASVVRRLLVDAPRVRMLVASQVPLHVAGEQEFPLAPLPVPAPTAGTPAPDTVAASPCVRLFLDRAGAVRPGFALDDGNAGHVVEICTRLQGLPLAIELAAAQARLLSPAAIADRLTTRLDALSARGTDVPERQRTLHAAVAWSYDLLDEPARALLRRLSVFAGGAALEQIEAVTAGVDAVGDAFEALGTLVDRSLVRPVAADDRYELLESIRSFGLARLAEAGETADAHRRHALAFAELAERVEPELYRSGRRRWLDRLAVDHDNLRAALDRTEAAGELEIALRIAIALWRFWQQAGHLEEAEPRIERLLDKAESATPRIDPALLDRAEEAAGGIAYWRRTTAITEREGTTSIERHYRRSLELARELGDPHREAAALYNLSFAYDFVAATRPDGTIDRRRALELRSEALERYRALGDARGIAYTLWGMASPVFGELDADAARAQLREAVELFRQADDAFGESWALVSMGMVEAVAGATEAAVRPLAEAARLFTRDGDQSGRLVLFDDIAALLARVDAPALAVRVAAARERFARETGALAPPIPIFHVAIEAARAALSPDELRREAAIGVGITFDDLLAAASAAEDEGVAGLARRVEELGTDAEAVPAARGQ